MGRDRWFLSAECGVNFFGSRWLRMSDDLWNDVGGRGLVGDDDGRRVVVGGECGGDEGVQMAVGSAGC